MNIDAMKKAASAVRGIDTKKKIIAAAALAAVVFIGGSYWAGKSTEQQFRDSAEEMSKFGVKVTVLDYQRGIFGATAHTEWVLPRSVEDPLTLSFNHSIRHGPILSFASASSIRSELMLSEELTALLVDAFGSDPFEGKSSLTIKSTFGLGGAVHARIVSPKLETSAGEGQTRLSWGGLDGDFSVSSDRSKVKANVVMDGLSITESGQDQPGKGQLHIGRVTFQTDMTKPEGYETLFAGTSSLVMDKLSFQDTDKNTGASRAYVLENARGSTDTSVQYGAMTLKIRLDADTFAMGDKSKIAIDKPGATFLYENIDVHALESISRAAQNAQEQSGQERQDTILVIQKQFKALLERKPALSIKDLSAATPEGATKGNFRIAYAGNGDPAQLSPADLAVDLQFSFPTALITRLLEEQASRGGAENAQAQKQAASINSLIDKGILVEKDNFLSVDATFKDSALTLNGKPQPLEALRGVF